MYRRSGVTLSLVCLALVGCAQAPPPLEARQGPATVAAATPTFTPGPTLRASSSSSASPASSTTAPPSLTPSVPAKAIATVTFPETVSGYRSLSKPGTGEQTLSYAGADPKDVIVVTVTSISDAETAASTLTNPARSGDAAVCGSQVGETKVSPVCVLPLQGGSIVVSGSGTQSLDAVAAFTQALWSSVA